MSRLYISIVKFVRTFMADATSNTTIKHGLTAAALSLAFIAAIVFLGDEIVAAVGRLEPTIDVSRGAELVGGFNQNR